MAGSTSDLFLNVVEYELPPTLCAMHGMGFTDNSSCKGSQICICSHISERLRTPVFLRTNRTTGLMLFELLALRETASEFEVRA